MVWVRADIMAGATSMRPFPESWENESDRFLWDDQKKEKAAPKAAA